MIIKSKDGELEKFLGIKKEDGSSSKELSRSSENLAIETPNPSPKLSNSSEERIPSLEEDTAREFEEILSGVGSENYKRGGFENPLEMLYFIDDELASGKRNLHKWQKEALIFITADVWDYEDRLKFCLTAANGSGKDAFIIAPLALYSLTEWIRSRFIATSKSAHQLNTQTVPYIKQLAIRYAKKLQEKGFHSKPFVFHGKPFHIACSFTGGEVLAFVTDEAENVEGYHSWPDSPKSPLTVVINEAKGVGDEYFDGFSRCTYSRWIEVTSPGRMTGRNWEHYDKSVKHPDRRVKGEFYSRKVTSYDCPHKSKETIEEDAILYGGKESELFRSKHLAEYTSINENVVLNLEIIDKYQKDLPIFDGNPERAAGLDLSLGGDETVLCTRQGNETKSIDGIRIKDPVLLESYLDKLMINRGLVKQKDLIYTDIGGLGTSIAGHLRAMGWKIVAIVNNAPAIGFQKNLYANRGTEIYFDVCNYYARGLIRNPIRDKLWREQLGSRKYLRPDNEKIRLQPKAQLKRDEDKKSLANAREWESPDRADAWVLSYVNFVPEEKVNRKTDKNRTGRTTQQGLIEHMEGQRFAGYKRSEGLIYKPLGNKGRRIIEEQLKFIK